MEFSIIERNFYRLLRSGAFGTEEAIEPMSVWKWGRLYHLSEMHDVAMYIHKGIERCSGQFFVQIPQALVEQWRQAATEEAAADHIFPAVIGVNYCPVPKAQGNAVHSAVPTVEIFLQ